jgi:chromosomal replication initiation ATPase DnaA
LTDPEPEAERLLAIVAFVCRVDPDRLRSRRRDRRTCRARGVAARLLRERGKTLAEVGWALGRHPSTVHHLLDVAPASDAPEVRHARAIFAGPDARG